MVQGRPSAVSMMQSNENPWLLRQSMANSTSHSRSAAFGLDLPVMYHSSPVLNARVPIGSKLVLRSLSGSILGSSLMETVPTTRIDAPGKLSPRNGLLNDQSVSLNPANRLPGAK